MPSDDGAAATWLAAASINSVTANLWWPAQTPCSLAGISVAEAGYIRNP